MHRQSISTPPPDEGGGALKTIVYAIVLTIAIASVLLACSGLAFLQP